MFVFNEYTKEQMLINIINNEAKCEPAHIPQASTSFDNATQWNANRQSMHWIQQIIKHR